MAIFHRAVLTPTKAEAISAWAPMQPWGGAVATDGSSVIGSYRFDDPDGRVGMEVHLVRTDDGTLLQVPLTYRDEPLADAAPGALITEMEHSVLGRRWVYDGVRDPLFVRMLAAVTMTGQGEALGMVVYDGRWHVAPAEVRLQGGGWSTDRVPLDRFELVDESAAGARLRNDGFELTIVRRPAPIDGGRRPLTLTATWAGQTTGPVLLSEVRRR